VLCCRTLILLHFVEFTVAHCEPATIQEAWQQCLITPVRVMPPFALPDELGLAAIRARVNTPLVVDPQFHQHVAAVLQPHVTQLGSFLGSVVRSIPENVPLMLLLAAHKLRHADTEAARRVLALATSRTPWESACWVASAKLEHRDGNVVEACSILRTAFKSREMDEGSRAEVVRSWVQMEHHADEPTSGMQSRTESRSAAVHCGLSARIEANQTGSGNQLEVSQ